MEYEIDVDTSYNWCAHNNHQMISTGIGGLRNKRMSGDHPKYNIIEIGLNTEKSPTCCHSNFSEKQSANACVEKAQINKPESILEKKTHNSSRILRYKRIT